MIKDNIEIKEKRGVNFVSGEGIPAVPKPWLGDMFAFMYDFFMKKDVFPKKFAASIDKHIEIMKGIFVDIHGKRILEIGTGSGSAAEFVPYDNHFIATDISPGLLRRSRKNFSIGGFTNVEYYVTVAEKMPFNDNSFDICLCVLTLNFFQDLEQVLLEIKRLLKPGGQLIVSIAVPEKRTTESPIQGTFLSENDYRELFEKLDFAFDALEYNNGALLYFVATT